MRASFVIPAYNAETTIRAAVESALRQSRSPLEVIIVDDASTDRTLRTVEEIKDPRIRVIRLATNSGPSRARNAAISAAASDAIAFLDADDVADSRRLELQLPILERNPRTVLVCGSAMDRDEADGAQSLHGTLSNPGSYSWALLFRNPVVMSTVTIRKGDALAVGGFCCRFDVAEDHAMWLDLACRGDFAAIPDIVSQRSVNPTSLSVLYRDQQDRASAIAAREAIANLTGREPSEAAYRVLRYGAGAGLASGRVIDEACATWCAVFDAVQSNMSSASHQRAAARESLNELRQIMTASPQGRFRLLRGVLRGRELRLASTMPSIAFLKLMRTLVEGR